jgi:hypothetical protein
MLRADPWPQFPPILTQEHSMPLPMMGYHPCVETHPTTAMIFHCFSINRRGFQMRMARNFLARAVLGGHWLSVFCCCRWSNSYRLANGGCATDVSSLTLPAGCTHATIAEAQNDSTCPKQPASLWGSPVHSAGPCCVMAKMTPSCVAPP